MRTNTSRVVGDVLSHNIVWNCSRCLLEPAKKHIRIILIVSKLYSTNLAMVSDQPSPIPPASVVCRQRPVPPPVIRLVTPWVISWLTISFSRAPSRSGWLIIKLMFNIVTRASCPLTEVRSQRNILMAPEVPLERKPTRQRDHHRLVIKTHSAGVEKSALSVPAESWTEMVTRSFPFPPLPLLLVWKLNAASVNP